MFEQRFDSDWRSIDYRSEQVQALRRLDELLARRSQLNGDRHVSAPLTPARQPVPELPKPPRKRSKGTVPPFPQEEVERFFAGIESARDRAIFRIMYHAGLRASEIGMLELRDYSGATERMMIHRLKGSNSGEHHLNREEAAALRAWLVERGGEPGPIFTSRQGNRISRKMLDVLVKKYAAMAGWPQPLRHCHVFKHASA
jgi:integrase